MLKEGWFGFYLRSNSLKFLAVMEKKKSLVCLGDVPLMRCEALDVRERFTETGECRFCSGRWLPSRFHLLPSHTPVDEIERLLTHTHSHSHTHTYSRHTSRSHSPSFIHTKAHTYALTNTNCSHFTVIWADMFTLLLIWMSPHCLASFFAILKTPLLSLSKLQADGDESAWLSLGSCESCFSFSLSLSRFIWRQYFILFSLHGEEISHLRHDTSLWGCKVFCCFTPYFFALSGVVFLCEFALSNTL